MNFLKTKSGVATALIVIILVLVGVWYFSQGGTLGVGGSQDYDGRMVTFSAPASYTITEYGLRSVIIGKTEDATLTPLVEIVEYRQDPQSPAPGNYSNFLQVQMLAFCGTDSGETVKCNGTHSEPYEAVNGYKGEKFTLRGTRTNQAGAVEEFEYGPIYAFNETRAATASNPLQYRALIISPSFTGFLAGEDTENLIEGIMKSLVIKDELSRVEGTSMSPTLAPVTATTTPQ